MSFLHTGAADVAVLALKRAEQGNHLVVRLVENAGQAQRGVRVHFPARLAAAWEIDGLEDRVGTAASEGEMLVVDFEPFQLRAFAVVLEAPAVTTAPVQSQPVDLPYDTDVVAAPGERDGGGVDLAGQAYSADQWPRTLTVNGSEYRLGDGSTGALNAVRCRGQRIELPVGGWNTVHLLAAAVGGDTEGRFQLGDRMHALTVQDYGAPVARPAASTDSGACVKRGNIAWVGTHRIGSAGERVPYTYCYLFHYALPRAAAAQVLQLPRNERIRVFAVTAAHDPGAGTQTLMAPETQGAPPAPTTGGPRLFRLAIGALMALACALVIARILRTSFGAPPRHPQ
jgi:alpha-mannosidase